MIDIDPELQSHLDALNIIIELHKPSEKLDILKMELKHKRNYNTNEILSEEELNEIPNKIRELEEEILEISKKSIELMRYIENKNKYNRLIEILKKDQELVNTLIERIDNNYQVIEITQLDDLDGVIYTGDLQYVVPMDTYNFVREILSVLHGTTVKDENPEKIIDQIAELVYDRQKSDDDY